MVSGRSDVAAGVFVGALVLGLVGLVKGWTLLWIVAAAVMLGVVVATARQRRTGPAPDFTFRPGGDRRPWRKDQAGE